MRTLVSLLLLSLLLVASAGAVAPDPQVPQLKRQLRQARAQIADQQDVIDTQNAVLSDQSDTILRLRTRIANWPDPIDVILQRDPDGLWSAVTQIFRAFPTLDPSQLCGYDKSSVPSQGDGLTQASYSFYKWSGC